jgi:hypothetical protein
MALDLKLKTSVVNDCKELVIQDVTGSYNSESNPGGWGKFNITGDRSKYTLNLMLTAFHFIDGMQYSTTITLTGIGNMDYPSESTFEGFKMSIPSHDISTAISELISPLPESYNTLQETVEDNIYKVTAVVSKDSNPSEVFTFSLTFTNTCNTEKEVNSFLASIDLEGVECDKSEIDRALLAKSLLQNLKNIK